MTVVEDEKFLTIYGIKYDKNLFHVLASGAVGQSLRIVHRSEDGAISLQKLTPGTIVPRMDQ